MTLMATINIIFFHFWRERAAFQRSVFGRSTAGNDVVATIFIRFCFFPPVFFWHERAAFQWSVFGRSTAGNDVVATIPISLFLSALRCYLFSKKECSDQKTYFVKVA